MVDPSEGGREGKRKMALYIKIYMGRRQVGCIHRLEDGLYTHTRIYTYTHTHIRRLRMMMMQDVDTHTYT